jgi:hypothetical protein
VRGVAPGTRRADNALAHEVADESRHIAGMGRWTASSVVNRYHAECGRAPLILGMRRDIADEVTRGLDPPPTPFIERLAGVPASKLKKRGRVLEYLMECSTWGRLSSASGKSPWSSVKRSRGELP